MDTPPDKELYLTSVAPAEKPWDEHRANLDRVRYGYQDSDFSRYFERMTDCSRWLEYVFEANDVGEAKLRLQDARFCRVRLCPVCQWRRSRMWRARFLKALPAITTAYPKARYLFLTLTVRNCPLSQLRATIQQMNQAWTKLSRRSVWPAIGWVKALEVTRNRLDKTAHPHFHVIVMVKPGYFGGCAYLSHEKWAELWRGCLEADYDPIVDIRVIKPKKDSTSLTSLESAILETLKYGVKESDLVEDRDWLIGVTEQLHKVKSIAVGGVLRQFISESEPEDLIHAEDEEHQVGEDEPRVYFGWREFRQRYAKQSGKKAGHVLPG